MDYGQDVSLGENVMWDFRQAYVQWIDKYYMNDYAIASRIKSYPNMLDKLKDWHSAVYGRAIKDFNAEIEENEDKVFNSILEKINETANKHMHTYLGRKKTAEGVGELDKYFRIGLQYIIWLMKKHKMFGTENINRGL